MRTEQFPFHYYSKCKKRYVQGNLCHSTHDLGCENVFSLSKITIYGRNCLENNHTLCYKTWKYSLHIIAKGSIFCVPLGNRTRDIRRAKLVITEPATHADEADAFYFGPSSLGPNKEYKGK